MVDLVAPAALRQSDFAVRFEWGPAGASALAASTLAGVAGPAEPEPDDPAEPDEPDRRAEVLVVVDVLSFTTAVSVAVGRGMGIVPHPFDDPDVGRAAADVGARVAARRDQVTGERPWSLSPASLAEAPVVERLLLPSPNGSAIAAAGAGLIAAACLRNREATFRWLTGHGFGSMERPVLVVAAGERWPDGSLRPALEDALGAGALLSRFRADGHRLSVEATAIAALYEATNDLRSAVSGSASGLQLTGAGYGRDVEMAVELDVDTWAAVGDGGPFERS